MTLDIKVLLKNLLKKQMSIQHFTAKTDVFSVKAIPARIKDKIKEEFGDQFLMDANYVVFFRGEINKDGIEKLFNLTNKAFGEDANRLVQGDFKKISFAEASEEITPDVDEETPPTKEKEPETPETTDDAETPIDTEVDKIVNEEKIKLDEDIQIDSSVDSYVFLKITTK